MVWSLIQRSYQWYATEPSHLQGYRRSPWKQASRPDEDAHYQWLILSRTQRKTWWQNQHRTNTGVATIKSSTSTGVHIIQNTVDSKVRELMEDKQFEALQSSIRNTILERNRIAEESRNRRMDTMSTELSTVKKNQIDVFWGGAIFGTGLGFLVASLSNIKL